MTLFLLAVGSAAQAIPVTFTYTSKTVDWSAMDQWEQDYMAASTYKWNLWRPSHSAQIQLEVDCDIRSGIVSCASLSSPASIGLFQRQTRQFDPVRLTGMSGFTESILTASRFRVGLDGRVAEWQFQGAEYGMVGDFRLSNTGDSWAYAGYSYDLEWNYCMYAYGVAYDWQNGICANGARIVQPAVSLALGVGTWTSNLAELTAVEAVPLPAGLMMALTGLGLLGAAGRRRGADVSLSA